MPIRRLLLLACLLWLVSFVASPSAGGAAQNREQRAQPAPGSVALHALRQLPLLSQQPDDAAGEDVSIGATWRSTMMANSARDPYWHAGVRRETIDHPTHAADIEDECAACHMPMAQKIAQAAGGRARSSRTFPSHGPIHPSCTASPPTASPARSVIRSRPITWARETASTATSNCCPRQPMARASSSDRTGSMPAGRRS